MYSAKKIVLKAFSKTADENRRYLHRLKNILTDNGNEKTHFKSRITDKNLSRFNSGIGEIFPFSVIFKEFKTVGQLDVLSKICPKG